MKRAQSGPFIKEKEFELKVADNYDEQVEVMVGSLMHLLEPVIIVVLGSIVMCIVLSVFLPMIQIITTLSSAA